MPRVTDSAPEGRNAERDRIASIDTRFTLANERTLLAWLRTALALLAAGGAVEQVSHLSGRRTLAILLGLIGIATATAGGWRYQRTAAAIRRGEGPIPGIAPVALAGCITVIGVVLVVAVAVE